MQRRPVTPPRRHLAAAPSKDELAKRLQRHLHWLDHHRNYHRCDLLGARHRTGHSARPLILGYAALFNCPSTSTSSGRYIVLRTGCFDNVLHRQPFVQMLVSHYSGEVIADTSSGTLALGADDTGLYAVANPHPAGWGAELVACIRANELTRMSFDLHASEYDDFNQDGKPYREVREVSSLSEISVVPRAVFGQTLLVVAGETAQRFGVRRGLQTARRKYLLSIANRP